MQRYKPVDVVDYCLYTCPVCDKSYPTKDIALACARQPCDVGDYRVGDIVIIPGKWATTALTQAGQDQEWIACTVRADGASTDHFDHVDHVIPFWVVTAITRDNVASAHDALIHVASLYRGPAIKPRTGRTPAVRRTHYVAYKLNTLHEIASFHRLPKDIRQPSQKVYDEGKLLWGQTAEYLL